MPAVKPGEKQSSYIGRAVPEMMGEGLTQKQALGKAYGMYREHWTGPKQGFRKLAHGKHAKS